MKGKRLGDGTFQIWTWCESMIATGFRRTDRGRIARVFATLLMLGAMMCGTVYAQDDLAQTLAERSAIVVRGKVVRTNASEEPLQAASDRTVVIKISKMFAGSEIAGDQTGRNATVILSRPGTLKAGAEALFFGNPRFAGKSLTIADEGEILSEAARASMVSSLERGVQARRDRPVRERLATASMVFRGKVGSVRPLDSERERNKTAAEPRSEHDPEWHVAAVQVTTPVRGGEKGVLIMVLFPASRDIMWFNSPKLRQGQEAIFITHKPATEDALLLRSSGIEEFLKKQPAELLTQPFDLLPLSDEARVRGLLQNMKEVQ